MFTVFFISLALGAVVGFLAGLLGIGGGLIIVPALLYLLPWVGVESQQLTHMAIATSLASIILTSMSAASAHHKRANIPWPLFNTIMPGIIFGALMAGFISEQISSADLQQVFAIFVILMAVHMAYPLKPHAGRGLPSGPVLFGLSLVIALLAGMMGIGGGVLMVPMLSYFGLAMRQGVGLSSATGFLIALSGSLGYVVAGFDATHLPDYSLGYIYLPALLGIVTTSMLAAPMGVKAASLWPTPVLKRLFALLLVLVGIKLISAG